MARVVSQLQLDIHAPSEVSDIARRISTNPKLASSLYIKNGTRAASNSFDPSSGGIGIMLKIARNRLNCAPAPQSEATPGLLRAAIASRMTAKITLLIGPAIATRAMPFSPHRSLAGFVLTGRPQPI